MIERVISSVLDENSYIAEIEGTVYVVDPGKGAAEFIKKRYGNEEVFVLLTHCHSDHLIDLPELKIKAIYMHPEEKIVFETPELNFVSYFGLDQSQLSKLKKFLTDEPGEHWKVLHTPGHTPGSCCYLLRNRYLFTGDTLFERAIGRTDLPGGDPKKMENSLRLLKSFLVNNPELVILPGHGSSTTSASILKENPFLNF
ncbi:MBL fold metallo-hydrolase [Kosmotoga sp. DU53]|uniref:MBL fold metallo-hydrolase n=1 Tax=Kosmotoga sp. DU53 TaxID=1310160 RepID=UPI0009ED8C86|nr:MBL fold metallo-hydrolase [Kosmotoga sp. DU53]